MHIMPGFIHAHCNTYAEESTLEEPGIAILSSLASYISSGLLNTSVLLHTISSALSTLHIGLAHGGTLALRSMGPFIILLELAQMEAEKYSHFQLFY
jgi:hypothetical protein